MATAVEELQKAVNGLPEIDRQSTLLSARVQGARATFNKKLYRYKNSRESLEGFNLSTSFRSIKERAYEVLKTWAKKDKFLVLMSEDLPVQLGLPVKNYPPDCWLFQVLLLGDRLPFLLLTLYDEESTDTKPQPALVEDFTRRCVRMLSSALLNYCRSDFALLPCTMSMSDFNVENLEKTIEAQRDRLADYYAGPSELNTDSLRQLDQALAIVAVATEVPYFFSKRKTAEKKLLVSDPTMEEALGGFIDLLGQSQPRPVPTIYYTEDTKVATAVLLEAAKRLSYRQKVVVITDDQEVQDCVEKLANIAKRDYDLDPSWFQCKSVQEAPFPRRAQRDQSFDMRTLSEKKKLNEARFKDITLDETPPVSRDIESGNSESGTENPADVCYIAVDAPASLDFPGLRLKLMTDPSKRAAPYVEKTDGKRRRIDFSNYASKEKQLPVKGVETGIWISNITEETK